ncbi:MAG: hypothetical protein HC838_02265 [Spirulinaceae cyanobacterium RM2_2_10]|nr:hypothetical protein [Spirulinaceae cyanobacterium RM2_2_10]
MGGFLLAIAIVSCGGAPKSVQQATEAAPEPQPAASIPAAQPFNPDFHEVKGNGVSLLLPPGYEGGNPQADIEAIANRLDGAGTEYEQLSEALRESKENISLIAFDTQQATAGFVTNVNIASQELPKALSAQEYIGVLANQLRDLEGYAVQQTGVEVINGNEVGRLVVDIQVGDIEIVQLFYAIPNEQNFWLVRYSTPKQEFEQRRRDFEQSILTFRF